MDDHPPELYQHPPHIQEMMRDILQLEDMRAFNLFRGLKGISRFLDVLRGEHRKEGNPSGARMRILVHLTVKDRLGQCEGVQPSDLAQFLGVSRNTISTLLNGLEEQRLIERHLHPTDRRQLLVRITPEGRLVVQQHGPEFGRCIVDLFSPLSEEEQDQLLKLLDKLFDGFLKQAALMGIDLPGVSPQKGEEHEP